MSLFEAISQVLYLQNDRFNFGLNYFGANDIKPINYWINSVEKENLQIIKKLFFVVEDIVLALC